MERFFSNSAPSSLKRPAVARACNMNLSPQTTKRRNWGACGPSVAFSQSRILLVWTRIIMPDSRSIVLDGNPDSEAGFMCAGSGVRAISRLHARHSR